MKRVREREVKSRVGCSTLRGKDNAISDVSRDNGAFVPHYFAVVPVFMTDANESF